MWICPAIHRSVCSQSDRRWACRAGKISDIIELDQFQEPEKIRAEKIRELERLAAEEAASLSKKQKQKKKKKQVGDENEEEEDEEVVSLTEPFIKKLRGTEALQAMVRTRFCLTRFIHRH
jgi:hypothetical protein